MVREMLDLLCQNVRGRTRHGSQRFSIARIRCPGVTGPLSFVLLPMVKTDGRPEV